MRIEAVLFDIDGTLIDSNEQHVIAWGLAFQSAGHPREAEAIRRQIGKGGDLLVPALLPDATEILAKELADRHGALFKDAYLERVRPFDRAKDLVEKVHRGGRKVVLASSAKREELDHYVERLGIGDKLAATTSIDDVDASKPEPDIFSAALAKIDVDADNAIVVGDTIYDVEAAARAGIAALGLTSGPFSAEELRDAGAVAVFADVADLLANFDHSPLTADPEAIDA